MSRRKEQVSYHLDTGGIRALPHEEIVAILRGADELIATGGRTLLAKVLKGSRDKSVLEHQLEQSPVYGYYHALSIEDIRARIDWVILNGYLVIEYNGRLPLLAYTPEGWEIEKYTYADELLRGFDALLASGETTFDMEYLKDRNRWMIMLLLDNVEATGNACYIPILQSWAQIDYRKVRERIEQVIARLQVEIA